MTKMNWSYVAGFFDGEGTVHITARIPTISIGQATRDDVVLSHIQQFLTSKHVKSAIIPKKVYKSHWLPAQTLIVCAHKDVLKSLKRMLPYLIVKRVIALKAIDHITNRKWRRSITPKHLLVKAHEAYKTGLSHRQAAAKYRIDKRVLFEYMKRNKLPSRTVSESIINWHQRMTPRNKRTLRRALRKAKALARQPIWTTGN